MTEEQWEGLLRALERGESVIQFGRGIGESEDQIWGKVAYRLRKDKEFVTEYARAKECGFEARMDQVREKIQKAPADDVPRMKLEADFERWEASKLLPKKYGDRLDVTSKGEQIGKVYLVPPGEEDWTEKV